MQTANLLKIERPKGKSAEISEVGENKQLLIAILSLYFSFII